MSEDIDVLPAERRSPSAGGSDDDTALVDPGAGGSRG
jgi:hypothetical protein